MKEKIKVRYEFVTNEGFQRRLDAVFDLIFAKIEEMKLREKFTLDRSILDDYTVFE